MGIRYQKMRYMQTDITSKGYSIYRQGHTTLIYVSSNPGLKDIIPTEGPIGEPTMLRGRSQIGMLGDNMVVRTLQHGGALRHITGDAFACTGRSIREIETSTVLRRNHIPTPEVLALRLIKKGAFYHITVLTKLVPNATDLLTYLESPGRDYKKILSDTGHVIRRMHELKIFHADLHLKNILLDRDLCPWIIDLDKARGLPIMPLPLKRANIRRFMRSCRKWHSCGRIHLPEDYDAMLMKGYNHLNQ